MSDQKFQVTKASIEAYVNNGLTIKEMADDISAKSGIKCSPAVIRAAGKTYGVNFLKKKKPTQFVFEDLANNTNLVTVTNVTPVGSPMLPTASTGTNQGVGTTSVIQAQSEPTVQL